VTNRGYANQALFEARILLDAWELAAEHRSYSVDALAKAFSPGTLMHLRHGYGWFLLAVSDADTQADPAALPMRVDDVPAPPQGRARAPELGEFSRLESQGWLGDMLRAGEWQGLQVSQSANVLGSDRSSPALGEFSAWAAALASIMARMDDSLGEY
jgi:hypothetical protein